MKIFINQKPYKCESGETILDVALRHDIKIPTLCKHPDLSIHANCRVCLVEVEGLGLVTSCSTAVMDKMKVTTDTKDVKRARKMNLQLIYAEHIEKCASCILDSNCFLQNYAKKDKADFHTFPERTEKYPEYKFADSIQMDTSKCIECRNCVEVCKEHQSVDFFDIKERGHDEIVKPTDREKHDCTYCGQCVVHCPVGALQGQSHWQAVEEILNNKNKQLIVAQIAPSIRVSIGEEFGLAHGQVVTGQLVASIKKLGFDAAFDVNLGADMTTYAESLELIEWLESGKDRPMLTSCCPGWVEFVKFYYPEFISHLTSVRSPHIISGLLAKTYWANSKGLTPKDVKVVSIMPCVAKKHEMNLPSHELDVNWCLNDVCQVSVDENLKDQTAKAVDYVLTTREYAYLLRRHKIKFNNLKPQEADNPLGAHSGAAVLYGASGGVMESALRTADYLLRVKQETGSLDSAYRGENYQLKKKAFSKLEQNRIEFKEVRGQQGLKESQIEIAGTKLKIAVVNGLGNARKLLDNLQDKKVSYDYVEVMACPGGCIGGGGQPVPTSAKIRKLRADALYQLSQNLPIHSAHQNESLLKVYKEYIKGDRELMEKMMHCKYEVKNRIGYKKTN